MTPRYGSGQTPAMVNPGVETLKNAILVMVGGGAGAASRYLLSIFLAGTLGKGFGWGTAAANVIGCFLIGVAAGLTERLLLPPRLWLLAVTGFLGGFTTFSTFSFEAVEALRAGSARTALATVALSLAGGLAATAAGLALTLAGRR